MCPSLRVKQENNEALHFVTWTVKNWEYIFDKYERFEILEQSFTYAQKHKQLKIYAYVLIINHIHFIAQSPDLIGTIRNMKKFLSHQIKENIKQYQPQLIEKFIENSEFTLLETGNHPESIETSHFFDQKVLYIHENPVRKGYVINPSHWKWSSACTTSSKIIIEDYS